MDDVTMIAKVDNDATVYVSPVHDHTYREYVDADNLGGSSGYFIARERGHSLTCWQKPPASMPLGKSSAC
ncbi:MAG: hypothetical protein AAF183_23975 [Pseudomonadota bacterium]